VSFYLLTTLAAVPGIVLFWLMMRAGLVDASMGTAGIEPAEDVRSAEESEPPAEAAPAHVP
jgi:PAT family beta-lactamase induction signal transducer AmpG